MFNFAKECAICGYTKQEYLEWVEYIKNIAKNIVEIHLKKSPLHNTGIYSDIKLLNSLIPFNNTNSKEYKQTIVELKKLGVEFYNINNFRY